MLRGTENIPLNILIRDEYKEIFRVILTVPHNIIMDMNNVM